MKQFLSMFILLLVVCTNAHNTDLAWQELGETTFNNCSGCHQATGEGIPATFPPLKTHLPNLEALEGGREYIINVLLYGLQGEIEVLGQSYDSVMPAWNHLSDEKIAAVINHELHSWGNDALLREDFSPILPTEVAALRADTKTPAEVYALRQGVVGSAASNPDTVSNPDATNTSLDTSAPKAVLGKRVVDIEGRRWQLGMENDIRPVALVFLDNSCAASAQIAPFLNDIYEGAEVANVAMYVVLSNPQTSWQDALELKQRYSLNMPVLHDSVGDIALRVQPQQINEAILVNQYDDIIYRGAADEALWNAMQAAANYEVPAISETTVAGCAFTSWDDGLPETVNYTAHIAPLMAANCTSCHYPGGIGPFSLESYENVQRMASLIALRTQSRYMPPFKPEQGFGHFRSERYLSNRQIALIDEWLKTGLLEGAQEVLAPQPERPSGNWRLGEPNLIVAMPEAFDVPATGDDIYRYFLLPTDLPENKVIIAMDFKPGAKTVVHHANFFVDYEGKARALDAEFEGVGFPVFETGAFMDYSAVGGGSIGGWSPGTEPYQLPEGLGIPVGKDGEFVIEIHYSLSGKAERDQSQLALYFADDPASEIEAFVEGYLIGSQALDIKAGDSNYQRYNWVEVPANMYLIDITPHMHLIGKEVYARATTPRGEEIPLICIKDWDLEWQNIYTYREPIFIPRGSTIETWFSFDNSANNPNNPFSPPQDITWGWQTKDEMLELWITALNDPRDSRRINEKFNEVWYQSGEPEIPMPDCRSQQLIGSKKYLRRSAS